MKTQARYIGVGDRVEFNMLDIECRLDEDAYERFKYLEVQKIHKDGLWISFKTRLGWTRQFNRQKAFNVVPKRNDEIDRMPIQSLPSAETFDGFSIE